MKLESTYKDLIGKVEQAGSNLNVRLPKNDDYSNFSNFQMGLNLSCIDKDSVRNFQIHRQEVKFPW